ncbi:glutamate ABC transporter substrate-binding protein [Actinophytocola sediminis]
MRFSRVLRAGAVVAAATLALAACGGGGDDGDGGGSGDGGGDAGGGVSYDELVIGIKFDQPGIGQKTPDGFAGLDVDVAKYVAKELGVEEANIEFAEAKTPEREQLIKRGDVDFIVASYSISDKRKEEVSFAGPYFVAHQDLLLKADNTSISSEEDLKSSSLRLCSVTGSTSAQNVKDDFAPNAQLKEYNSYSQCLTGVENGEIDALTTDDTILAGYAAQSANEGKFKLAGLNLSDEMYGIGLEKGNTELQTAINDAITKMIEDGSWQKAVEENLGPAGYETPEAPEITETS